MSLQPVHLQILQAVKQWQGLDAALQGLGKEIELSPLAQCRSLENMQGDYLVTLTPPDFRFTLLGLNPSK